MFLNICEESGFLSLVLLAKEIIDLISIFVPIILIVMIGVQVFKMVMGNVNEDFKKGIKGITLKMIAAVCIFFVPVLVNLFLSMLNKNSYDSGNCWSNANSTVISAYRALEEAERKQKEEEKKEAKRKADEARQVLADLREAERVKNEEEASKGAMYLTGNERFPGTKYNLTEAELLDLAKICASEQSGVIGAKAEASLMANLFEKKMGGSYKGVTGGTGLRNYVRNGGWFAHAASKMDDPNRKVSPEVLAGVRDVLVNGNRLLPAEVVNHDCWLCNAKTCNNGDSLIHDPTNKKGDICGLEINGVLYTDPAFITNKKNYIRDKTIMYSIYGGKSIFFVFPNEHSDPFGYK